MLQWSYEKDGERHGPVTKLRLRELLERGEISADTLVWRNGLGAWTPAGRLNELRNSHDDLRENSGRARWTVRLLQANAVAAALAVLVGLDQVYLLQRIRSGTDFAEARVALSDDLYVGLGSLQILVLLVTAVVFLGWFRRAYENTTRLTPEEPPWTPKWSVIYWLIPIINLFRPYTVTRYIWTESHRAARPAGEPRPYEAVTLWWGAWILTGFVSRVGSRLQRGDDIGDLLSGAIAFTMADLLFLAAALLAAWLVGEIQRAQELAARAADRPVATAPA